MNAKYGPRLPSPLTLLDARAIQQPALQLWQGLDANAKVAQDALLYGAKCNRAAREGKYSQEMESGRAGPGRCRGFALTLGSQD
jgi:fructose-bisphosphate aldolase, class I